MIKGMIKEFDFCINELLYRSKANIAGLSGPSSMEEQQTWLLVWSLFIQENYNVHSRIVFCGIRYILAATLSKSGGSAFLEFWGAVKPPSLFFYFFEL